MGTGRTVEAAIADGARKLGADPSRTQYEIIEAPKKGFLGFGESPAKVWVYVEVGSEQIAVEYLKTVTEDMEMDTVIEVSGNEPNFHMSMFQKMKSISMYLLFPHPNIQSMNWVH